MNTIAHLTFPKRLSSFSLLLSVRHRLISYIMAPTTATAAVPAPAATLPLSKKDLVQDPSPASEPEPAPPSNPAPSPASSTESVKLIPSAAAPNNVFIHDSATLPAGCTKAWTNTYEMPVEYTVEIHSDLLSPANDTLATRFMPAGLKRRFCVVDEAVHEIYGDRITSYFASHGVALTVCIVPGEECNKRKESVKKILDALCEFGLLRREPVFAIGGGCVLDIVGYTASSYRRGVPYVRVPTTLLSIVDASVGVKTGIDWYHDTKGGLKNRVGSFYAPIGALLDKSFIASQDERNIVNGTGEIMKLALIRSRTLYDILEKDGKALINEKYQSDIGTTVIELSIEIMLEELGPNLWEHKLERCVDYGHTFSKILEMADPNIMHGEAVNMDGYFCVILAYNRGWITRKQAENIARCMRKMKLPIWDKETCTPDNLWKAIGDGIEHRHGKLRMPLVNQNIGQFAFVNDVTREEIVKGIEMAEEILFELF